VQSNLVGADSVGARNAGQEKICRKLEKSWRKSSRRESGKPNGHMMARPAKARRAADSELHTRGARKPGKDFLPAQVIPAQNLWLATRRQT
jgi:hypothetical protein